MMYQGMPLSSYIGINKDEVIKVLGKPQRDEWGCLSYDDISFGYEGESNEIYYINIDSKMYTFNGNTLDKDREGVIELFGEPESELWDESGFQRNFVFSNWYISTSPETDNESEIASYLSLCPIN